MDNGEKRRADPAVAGSGAAREEPPGGYKCPRCGAAPRRDRDKNLANARKREKEREGRSVRPGIRDLRPQRREAERPPWPAVISACDGTIRHHR